MATNPRFPNRPQHPDFELLAEVARGLDKETERLSKDGHGPNEIFQTVADPDSIIYLATERGKMAVLDNPMAELLYLMRDSATLELIALAAACQSTGIVMGARYQQAINRSKTDERIEKAMSLIESALHTDGAHHLQWYLNEIAKILAGPQYEIWRDGVADRAGYDFEEGIAP